MKGAGASGDRAGVLAVDAHRLLGPQAGVARYLRALLREWAASELPFARVVLLAPGQPPAGALPSVHPFESRILPSGAGGVGLHWTLAHAARDADVLFCPSYVSPLPFRGRTVVTTHDAVHELLPETFPRRARYRPWLYRRSARRADAVITDSEASRSDLIRLYGLDPQRVHAILLAADEAFSFPDDAMAAMVRERYGLGDGPLVLYVGRFSHRRNLPALVRAFGRCRARLPPGARLALVGDDPLGLPLADEARRADVADAVRLLGHVDDEDLPALYRAATVFVYPSDHEGFGLPPLEAMAAGTAVVTLANSSLLEVVGDAGLLLPRADEDALAGAIERLVGDPRLRAAYAARGRERAAMFSWRRTARQTIDVLADVAGRS